MNVLLIEDNPDHADLIQHTLTKVYKNDVDLDCEDRLKSGLERLQKRDYDLLLCDLKLPDSDIDSTVTSLQNIHTYTPIVVLTSLDDESLAQKLINTGIQDYLPKEDLSPNLLFRVCSHSIERKKQTVMLEHKNADQARFCYSLCHDFKEPIRKIASMLSMLHDDLNDRVVLTDNNKRCIESAERNAASLINLIDGLYEYLNLDSTKEKFTEVDLNQVFEQLDTEYSQQYSVKLSVAPMPVIQANYFQMYFLFKNIIANSVKYNRKTPKIRVDVTHDESESTCTIHVTDNGIGINKEYLQDIFTPFVRLHSRSIYSGTGLGLSIVKRVAENHRGRVHIDSEIDRGTTVSVTLPIKQVD